MECIKPVVEIITRLWDPIACQVKYFTKIEENVNNLGNQVEELKARRDDLKREVEQARRAGKVPTDVVQLWQLKANEIIQNAREMQEEFQGNKKCFYGWCLDCSSRYKLGKRIVKETQNAKKHIEKKKDVGEIVVPPPRESVQELPTATIREGPSSRGTLDLVWNWLMDAETRKIGIWGTGGVGKTTLVKNINNKLSGTRHFEEVIFVTVSRDWNIKKLRNDIGKMINLDLSEEEDETRASISLFNKLKGKRFLLILDDMWEKVDLVKLGVLAPEKSSGCKIIITTRYRGVCRNMEMDKEIEVKVLSEEEAWELFKEKADNEISSDLEPIARDVCKECDGLPLAIIVLGRALRKENNPEVWEHALTVLRKSKFELEKMYDDVYVHLKYSYNHLETEDLRNCFLYCSLFPEDYEIDVDDLIKYWTMEGFIKGVESLKEASNKGHYLLKKLIDSCLLEKVEDRVRMHDVIRDMAIKITSDSIERGRRFLVRAGVELEVCPEVEKWEGKDRISLMRNQIRFLPDEPKCSELSTLLLQSNKLLKEIPPSFFRRMKNLRVLDLSDTRIVELPHSISELGSLQALILRRCVFLKSVTHVGGLKQLQLLDLSNTSVMALPPSISELGSLQALILRQCQYLKRVTHVGGLKQLQLLDLSFTEIVELPHEIGQLTRLRCLNLSGTSKLAHIPADIIGSLSLLEDLQMWGNSSFMTSNESEAFIKKLQSLKHLTYFSADIPNDLLTSSRWEFLLRPKHNRFQLRIGLTYFLSIAPKRNRYLQFTRGANVSQESDGLVQYAEKLVLNCQNEIRTISAMGAHNLNQLKECWVCNCDKMENVVITEEAKGDILPELEILYLLELQNLRSIWEGNGTPGSFRSIKMITLSRCPNVMHLFSSNVLQLLDSLEELRISKCHQMVEIVTGEVGNGVIALPKLWRIGLHSLPELNRMWEGVLSLESLRELEVLRCASLRQLAIDIEKTPALKVIRGERKWWDSLAWRNDSIKAHFQNKFEAI